MQVTVEVAETMLPKLIQVALSGEEVVIVRSTGPVARLVAIHQPRLRIGLLEGEVNGPGPDFLAPMDEHELTSWEGRD